MSESVFEPYGAELRKVFGLHKYELKAGITNRSLVGYADRVFKTGFDLHTTLYKGGDDNLHFNPDFIHLFIQDVVNAGYAVKVVDTASVLPPYIDDLPIIIPNIPKESEALIAENNATHREKLLIRTALKASELPPEEEQCVAEPPPEPDPVPEPRRLRAVDTTILWLRSAQWAFLVAVIGVLGQSFHIYHVTDNLSDLDGFAKVFNSLLWAVFFSFGLLYFSLKVSVVDPADTKLVAKYKKTINWFILFDIFANLYYWSNKFVLMPAVLEQYMKEYTNTDGTTYMDVDWQKVDWFTFDIARVQWPQMLAAIVFSFAIPFILKSFAGEVRLPRILDKKYNDYDSI